VNLDCQCSTNRLWLKWQIQIASS